MFVLNICIFALVKFFLHRGGDIPCQQLTFCSYTVSPDMMQNRVEAIIFVKFYTYKAGG